MHTESKAPLVNHLDRYETVVEVGVGRRPSVAAGLAARGRDVTATDIHEYPVPRSVQFIRDDITTPALDIYRDADAVYALHCPPELQQPLVETAATVDADCWFTTLGGDPAVVDATPHTVAHTTMFTVNP